MLFFVAHFENLTCKKKGNFRYQCKFIIYLPLVTVFGKFTSLFLTREVLIK